MTKKDFFRVIIKVFGLYSIVSMISVLSGIISKSAGEIGGYGVALILVVVAAMLWLVLLLINKSDKVISALNLDKGFDDDRMELTNFNTKNIVQLGAIVIGAFLIINNVPPFLSQTWYAFKASNTGDSLDYRQNIYWATSGLNLIIGYLLISNFERIGKILKTDDN